MHVFGGWEEARVLEENVQIVDLNQGSSCCDVVVLTSTTPLCYL